MIEKTDIEKTYSTSQLNDLLEEAADDRNYELDLSLPYDEQAELLRKEMPYVREGAHHLVELAEMLDMAHDLKWRLEPVDN